MYYRGNMERSYLSSLADCLRDLRHSLKIFYTPSLYRVEREKTSLGIVLIDNLRGVCSSDLDSLLVPVGVYGGVVYKPQYATRLPTVFLRQGDNFRQDDEYPEPEKKRKKKSESYHKKNRKKKPRVRRRRVRMRRLGRAK